jgi:hypothetical protein
MLFKWLLSNKLQRVKACTAIYLWMNAIVQPSLLAITTIQFTPSHVLPTSVLVMYNYPANEWLQMDFTVPYILNRIV